MENIAVVLCAGMDGAGGNTFAQQIKKVKSKHVKFDVYANTKNAYACGSNKDIGRNDDFILFDTYKQLYNYIKDYKHIIVATPPNNKDKQLSIYYKMLNKLKGKKYYFVLDRTVRTVKKVMLNEEHVNMFDYIVTIASEESKAYNFLKSIHPQVIAIDFNFYRYEEELLNKTLKYKHKNNIISYCARFANMKGWNKIVEAYINNELNKSYIYTLEGGLFSYENGKLSSTIAILPVICKDYKKKIVNDGLILHGNYDDYDKIDNSGLHIFPSYAKDEMLERLRKAKFALFPTMYDTKLNRYAFKYAIEYTWLESINVGTPIIASAQYGRECVVNGKPLIEQDCGLIFFERMKDIYKLVKEYEKNYDKNVEKMQKFFIENYTNKSKLKELMKIL